MRGPIPEHLLRPNPSAVRGWQTRRLRYGESGRIDRGSVKETRRLEKEIRILKTSADNKRKRLQNPPSEGRVQPPLESLVRATRALPRVGSGVYFLISGGRVMYVGTAQEIMKRACSHGRFDEIRYIQIGSRAERYEVEAAFIRVCAPPLNDPKFRIPKPTAAQRKLVKRWLKAPLALSAARAT